MTTFFASKTFLAPKTFLVTGAGRGIGRGIALAVAEAGGRVAAIDVDASSLEETVSLIRDAAPAQGDGSARPYVADVTERDQVESVITAALDELGEIGGLVTNAGVVRMASALETSDEDHAWQFAVNVDALFLCCRIVARRLIAQGTGGAIVNVASNAGKVGYPNMASYNASKAAVINLTRSLAAEWAEHRINVNAVCPGGVDTPMLREVAEWVAPRLGGDAEELWETMVPTQLGRHVRPIEVGRVVAFLLSESAVVIRGQAINVDGGDTPY